MKRSLLLQSGWVKIVGLTFFQLAIVSIPCLESSAASIAISRYPYYQQVKISGTVTDESGTPLPGVGVRIKGSNAGAATDATGKYSINVPDGPVTLVFS